MSVSSPALRRYFRTRAPWLGAVMAIALITLPGRWVPASADLEGIREALGRASQAEVTSVAWEPSRGLFGDLLFGRPVLFLGRLSGDETAQTDLHRAFVRLAPDGTPLSVVRPRNITRTHLAEETGLVVQGDRAVYATVFADRPTGVTVLDLQGERSAPGASLLGKLQLLINRYLETGSWAGLGHTDLNLPEGTRHLRIELSDWNESASQLPLGLNGGPARPAAALVDQDLQVASRTPEPTPLFHWLADLGRRAVGNSAIAWLEGRVFGAWDDLERLRHSVGPEEKAKAAPPRPLPLAEGELKATWPPRPVSSRFESPQKGEGIWVPMHSELLAQQEFGPGLPPFMNTFIRPDPERPYAKMMLVAMDMRRLSLGIRAGYEDPHPETGPPGSGHVPADPEIYERIVATFNGAFKATHGAYGMKVEGRVLVPARDGAATVTVDRSGAVAMGTWNRPNRDESLAPQPDDPRSFRQNMDPLVDGTQINPAGREVWGDQLYGEGVAAERSALCVTAEGNLVYGWSTRVTGRSLAEGMAQAGCVYAMHLDMNPGHCAFMLNRVRSFDPLRAEGEVLHHAMKVNATRYIRWSPKDFFYVARRRSLPPPRTNGPRVKWAASPGLQPPPASVPAIVRGEARIGELPLTLRRLDLSRLEPFVLLGQQEPSPSPAPEIDLERAQRVLAVFGLGHATHGSRPGLAIDQLKAVSFDRSFASLVLDRGERPRLQAPGEAPLARPGRTVVQFPVWARDGTLNERARELGGVRTHAALCLDTEGQLLVGTMRHDTPAPLVQTLIDLGCGLVVELDRGSHSEFLFERAGTDAPPKSGHSQTALYFAAKAMAPPATRF